MQNIKDSSYFICAGPAGDRAEDMEKAAKSGNYAFVSKNNADLIETVNYLIKNIKKFVSD